MTNPITERIAQHYSSLTEGNRRLADYLLLNPEKILMLSTNEIAEACSVSKTSVSRFIRTIGYQDHSALRSELLSARDKGVPIVTSSSTVNGFSNDVASLDILWKHLAETDLNAIIQAIAKTRKVKIIGYRNSYPVAMHFRQQLLQCRQNVELLPLPGQTIGEDVASIGEDDFVIVLGIRRRIQGFSDLIKQLSAHQCLLITDQTGIKYTSLVSHLVVCPMSNDQPLDSYAAPMALISHLSNRVYDELGREAKEKSKLVADIYSQLNELES